MTDIKDLDIKGYTRNALLRVGIDTTDDLANVTEEYLMTKPNLGKASMLDLRDALQRAGLPPVRARPPKVCPHCGGEL